MFISFMYEFQYECPLYFHIWDRNVGLEIFLTYINKK